MLRWHSGCLATVGQGEDHFSRGLSWCSCHHHSDTQATGGGKSPLWLPPHSLCFHLGNRPVALPFWGSRNTALQPLSCSYYALVKCKQVIWRVFVICCFLFSWMMVGSKDGLTFVVLLSCTFHITFALFLLAVAYFPFHQEFYMPWHLAEKHYEGSMGERALSQTAILKRHVTPIWNNHNTISS